MVTIAEGPARCAVRSAVLGGRDRLALGLGLIAERMRRMRSPVLACDIRRELSRSAYSVACIRAMTSRWIWAVPSKIW